MINNKLPPDDHFEHDLDWPTEADTYARYPAETLARENEMIKRLKKKQGKHVVDEEVGHAFRGNQYVQGQTEGHSEAGKTPKTKKEIIGELLKKGTTIKEILTVTKWPSVSVPQQAAALGMKVEKKKEGGKNVYYGTPMTAEEKAALKAQAAAVKAQKLAAKAATPTPEPTPGLMPTWQTFLKETPAPAGAIDMENMAKLYDKMGSNKGGVYQDKTTGKKYYIKEPPTWQHVQNELMAAALYKLAGVHTKTYVPVVGGDHVAAEFVDLMKTNISQFNADERQEAQKDFAAHAWLANWDAAGTGGDNQVINTAGDVMTIDTGGALKYRAQGEPKGALYGDKVIETDTLRDPSKNPDAAALYGSMTNEQIVESIKRVTDIPVQSIAAAILHAGGTLGDRDRLLARQQDLVNQAMMMSVKFEEPTPPPPTPSVLHSTPTQAELNQAQKSATLQLHNIPGIKPAYTETISQAQALVTAFNAKYAGKALTEPHALAEKVANFKELNQAVNKLGEDDAKKQEVEQKATAAAYQAQKAAYEAEKAAKAAAIHENNLKYMNALGISEKQALGMAALAEMLGKDAQDLSQAFLYDENEAKNYGYPISGFQCALLKNYTGSGYAAINTALRKGAWTPAQQLYVSMVNKAIMGMPAFNGVATRGTSLNADQQSRYIPGHIVQEHAFMSTSTGTGFSGNTRFKVTGIGKRGADVKELSNHPGEHEVLFAARTLFHVDKVEGTPGGEMTIHLTEWEED